MPVPARGQTLGPVPHICRCAQPLSARDRVVGARAASLAEAKTADAVRWLVHQTAVTQVRVGRDGKTLELKFRDGRHVAILPAASEPVRSPQFVSRDRAPHVQTEMRQALVLEPFASELGLGPNAGQDEIDDLSRAGYSVHVARDTQVTVPLMETLPTYAAVYFQTHAGVLSDGDAIVVTGDTNTTPYAALFRDGSLMQAFVAGDSTHGLYDAITSKFIAQHLARFTNGSLLFINGCTVLGAPVFWSALSHDNVSALISWDKDVGSDSNDAAGSFVLARLANGETVGQVISDALISGVGYSVANGTVARLGFEGNAATSLISGPMAVPATASPTAVPRPTATPKPRPKAHCRKGFHRVKGKCRLRHKYT